MVNHGQSEIEMLLNFNHLIPLIFLAFRRINLIFSSEAFMKYKRPTDFDFNSVVYQPILPVWAYRWCSLFDRVT